jgi:4-hydroxybenzoate polyprenyltransferase
MDSNEVVAPPLNVMRLARGLVRSMRPKQWVKNIFVFAALVFDSKLFQPHYVIATLIGFVVLCMLSSAVYLVNDSADVQADRQHPKKRYRPIAAGDVPVPVAIGWAVVLVVVGLLIGFATNVMFGLIALTYLITATLYTFRVKHMVVLDVLFLAAGFVLRVAAGAPLVEAERFSPWLYTCMGLLALLIGFGKRRGELVELDGRSTTRAILSEYSVPFLDQMIAIVTGALILAYTFYTFSAPQLPANHTMMLTVPFVVYGLFRYLYLVHVRREGGAPDELAFKDRSLQIAFLLWGLVAVIVIYFQGKRI